MILWRRRTDDEGGLVIVYFAMTLTVLLIASAFTVDVGAWYRRAEQIQRAADAAAMAGTTYLPNDPAKAVSTAVAVAAQNGFTDGANGGTIHVTAQRVSGEPRELQVDITDDKLPQYFSKTFYGGTSAHRKAIAQYAPPVEIGSPVNGFGTGDNWTPTGETGDFWAAIDGYCSPREQGDLIMAHGDGEYVAPNTWNCASSTADSYSASYDPSGYDYKVDIPAGHGTILLTVYDPAFVPYYYGGTNNSQALTCGSPDTFTQNWPQTSGYALETDYTVTKPDGTVETPDTFPSTEGGIFTGQRPDTTDCDKYAVLDTVQTADFPNGGTYKINVKTLAGQQKSFGSNMFSILAVRPKADGSPDVAWHCTSIGSSTCPQVHGTSVMSVYMGTNRLNGDIWLAQIDSAYKNQTLNVSLWDPGEGGNSIQIEDNKGHIMPFTWSVTPCSPPTCSSGPTPVTSLDVSDVTSNPQPQPGANRVGQGTYNDRLVTLSVQIPNTYTSTYASTADGWWQLKYDFRGSVADRTTWAVSVTGSPVKLLEG